MASGLFFVFSGTELQGLRSCFGTKRFEIGVITKYNKDDNKSHAACRIIRGRVCSDIIYGTVKPNYSSALSRNAVRYTYS